MQYALTGLQRYSPVHLAGGVLAGALAVILAAHGFEEIGGYIPCPLCLQQRYAYYAAIPALAIALGLIIADRRTWAAALLALVAIMFIANAGLGAYQAGAEWKMWDPPASCAAPAELPTLTLDAKGLNRRPVSCGVASWRLLGLSFAGWNVVASAALALGSVAAVAAIRKQLPPSVI
jgi:disulfide bond formation protein DsbB